MHRQRRSRRTTSGPPPPVPKSAGVANATLGRPQNRLHRRSMIWEHRAAVFRNTAKFTIVMTSLFLAGPTASAGAAVSGSLCALPAEAGVCLAVIERYFHNAVTGRCEMFIWGGCGGNDNNFETIAECEAACPRGGDECFLPPVVGDCLAAIPRYSYDACSGQCAPFTYGGCGGNANNFETLAECAGACIEPRGTCLLPSDVGPCDGVCQRFFHNVCTGQCEQFSFGCCDGNANNFQTLEECEVACPPVTNRCDLPTVAGPCEALIPAFHYNAVTGLCEPFIYGGCDGTPNMFETQATCEAFCPQGEDICSLPAEVGPCDGVCPRFFHNTATGQCEVFGYGCCGGNANNFLTLTECESACSASLLQDIPTLSDWGVVAMALLTLSLGTIVLRHRYAS